MEIETISPANLAELAHLALQLWPECSYREEYENLGRMLHSDRETAFLCKDDAGAGVAFITLSLRFDYVEGTRSSPVGYVEGIYVAPPFRKQRIAARLLRAGEDWCRARGCREIASDTELSNRGSQAFHRKSGFVEVNRIVCFQKTLSPE